MSSSYYVLCMSHDPATMASDKRTPEEAAAQIKIGVEEHPGCDFVIERVSGGPIEIGCPPHNSRPAGPKCYHDDVQWIDVEWLRILDRAYKSEDPLLAAAVRRGRFTCWPAERVHRLRHSLGTTDEDLAAG